MVQLFFWKSEHPCCFLSPPPWAWWPQAALSHGREESCGHFPFYQERQTFLRSHSRLPYISLTNRVTSPPLIARESRKVDISPVPASLSEDRALDIAVRWPTSKVCTRKKSSRTCCCYQQVEGALYAPPPTEMC